MDKKIQWHPAFCSAMRLELRANKNDLMYENEYNLNTKPLQVDLLVIKKRPRAVIENPIGRIFRGHNIIEYKSPEDSVDIDTYYKTTAYACLYKASEPVIDAIPAGDITISIVREAEPVKLLSALEAMGNAVTNPYAGIYYVTGSVLFPMQIIVSRKLEHGQFQWLKALTQKMDAPTARNLITSSYELAQKDELELADSVLQTAVSANKKLFETVRRDKFMCEALMELMKPEIDAIVHAETEKAAKEAAKEAEKAAKEAEIIGTARDLGVSDEKIQELLKKRLHYNAAQIASVMKKYNALSSSY